MPSRECERCGKAYRSNYRGAHPICGSCREQPAKQGAPKEIAAATIVQAHMRGFWIRSAIKEIYSSPEQLEFNQQLAEIEAATAALDLEPPQGENSDIWRLAQTQRLKNAKDKAMMAVAKLEATHSLFNNKLDADCWEGRVEEVRRQLDGGEPIRGENLALACINGHAPLVQLLLERGASANSSAMKMPALVGAAMGGHVSVLALLLDHRADWYAPSMDGSGCALVQASRGGHTAALELLLARCQASDALPHQLDLALLCACEQGKVECARKVLSAGANANARITESSNMPIVCLASQHGQLECVALLLKHDADVNASGIGGMALLLACQQGHSKLAQMLLAEGANVNQARADGINALIVACATGQLECAQLCSAYGAQRNVPRIVQGDPEGFWDALDTARRYGHSRIATWLQQTAGWSALHHVEQLDRRRAESLLRSGECVHAPANPRDADHGVYVTPFMRAIELLSMRRKKKAPAATYEAAEVLVAAGRLWSCATHRLAPSPKRRRAFDLLRLGYQIARHSVREEQARAFLDVWRGALMPIALTSMLCEGTLVHLNLATDPDRDHRPLDGCIGEIEPAITGVAGERAVSVIGRTDGPHLDRRPARGGRITGGEWGPQSSSQRSRLCVCIHEDFMAPVDVAQDGVIRPCLLTPPAATGTTYKGKGKGKAAAADDRSPPSAAGAWPSERARDSLVGKHVRLHGLSGRPELNGSHGVVQSWEADRGRYAVVITQGAPVLCLKPENLELLVTGSAGTSGGAGGARATQHLRQRQAERGISDADLEEAVRVGERTELPDDTVHYKHKGVVFVTKDGMGLTAYRVEPEQCICNLTPAQVANARMDFESASIRRGGNPVHAAIAELQIGMMKAQFACQDCLGCRLHRTPTDPVAMFLERIDFSLPKYRGLFGEGYMRGLLLLMAAGSLLVPVRCDTCHGIHKLRRHPNPIDEGSTCTWIRHLLDLNPRANTMPLVDYREVQLAGGCTPLSAAAKAGHFRCCVDLLRYGASREDALMDLNGPLAGGHVICFLNQRARMDLSERIRQQLCVAYYPEILQMLSAPYRQPDYTTINQCAKLLKINAAAIEQDEGGPKRADSLEGAEVTMRMMSYDDDPPSMRLKPGGKFGVIWDGFYWRLLLKGPCSGPPACAVGERCFECATYAQSTGICYLRNESDGRPYCGMGADPMHNEGVKTFIRSECRKAGCNAGECQVLGRHNRLPPRAPFGGD